MQELLDLLARLAHSGRCPLPLSPKALNTLFYYMRCSQVSRRGPSAPATLRGNLGPTIDGPLFQLEHGERGPGIQELAYERAYVVLPPLVEWLRVASSHAEYRHSQVVDHDDVGQAARLLLPGVDCPVRLVWLDRHSASP
jgi:ankyrin repeat/BTB/POZ domain-containing protein 2